MEAVLQTAQVTDRRACTGKPTCVCLAERSNWRWYRLRARCGSLESKAIGEFVAHTRADNPNIPAAVWRSEAFGLRESTPCSELRILRQPDATDGPNKKSLLSRRTRE